MRRLLQFTAALLCAGCATIESPDELSPPPGSYRAVAPKLLPIEAPSILSLRDALALALTHSPKLAALALEVEALAGAEIQAGLLPNPTLSLDAENFGRVRKAANQLNGPEYTLAVGQLVELGGKRAARVRAARWDRRMALWDYESGRVALLARTARDFVAVLTAQEAAGLAREGVRVAREILEAVQAKIEAGKVSPVEETRAAVTLARARLAVDRADGELAAVRARLAANWGADRAAFEQVAGDLSAPSALPSMGRLAEELVSHPDVARWADEVKRREAQHDLARANRVPDPTVGAGGRFLDESDESGFVIGLSIPLPVSDRNQGAIREADRRVAQARSRQRAAFIERRAALSVAFAGASSAERQVRALDADIVSGAERALEATREAYREGRLGLTDVLDTERAWFATRMERLAALRDYHGHRAELETLIGRPLNDLTILEKQP